MRKSRNSPSLPLLLRPFSPRRCFQLWLRHRSPRRPCSTISRSRRRSPQGLRLLRQDPLLATPTKPAGVYDPQQVFNSGRIGSNRPEGNTWALTFDVPGTFEYFCGIHRELGMKGTITVLPR